MRNAKRRGKKAAASAKAGQAMVEAILAMILLVFAVLALAQFADNFRTRLLLDYAALRAARARAVGFNDFMVEKTAKACTLPVAGECYSPDENGKALSRERALARIGDYLASAWQAQARAILDFEYWQNGLTHVEASDGRGLLSVSVSQRRKQFFPWAEFAAGKSAGQEADAPSIRATATIESHYPDYLR